MKKTLFSIVAILGLLHLPGCSDGDHKYPMPTALDQASVFADPEIGAVKLKWTVPPDSNYYYVKVTYTLPENGKRYTRMASVYSDTLLVDHLYKRYGDIQFTLQPCNRSGECAQSCTVTAQALPVAKQIINVEKGRTPLVLEPSQLYTDSQESTGGPIKNLLDGNRSTFFHMSWRQPSPFPHYIVIDLGGGKGVCAFHFSYICRNHNNKDNPKDMDILGSNTFDGMNYDDSQTTLLASLKNLPAAKAASYSSNLIRNDKSYRYIWFKIKSATSGKNWVALAELSITKGLMTVYDPETGETDAE